MSTTPQAIVLESARAPGRALRDFVALTKPRVVSMVIVTATVGFYLGSSGGLDYGLLLATLIGIGLAAAGTLALNQYLERDLDAQMHRTRERPLPAGRLLPADALVFGAATTAAGLIVLSVAVNALSASATAATVVSYLWLYTPLKRTTPLCSLVGAIPGALPPVSGWVAASGSLDPGAWVLFAILFLWQVPHSLAVAQLYADDYARAGFRLLPVVDRDGHATERQIVGNSVALLGVGLLPTVIGVAGPLYFFAALLLGSAFLLCGLWSVRTASPDGARRLLIASLLYLPALLACMAADKVAS